MKTRNQFLELASTREYDLVVLGGGIVGAGIAQDAACRGLSVLVIDKDDFASGTSSKTTKLIHGGLRYLEQFRFKLTLELLKERTLLEQLAPHLIKDFSFVLPIQKGHPFQSAKAEIGLFLYDLLALSQTNHDRFKHLSQKDVWDCAPALANPQIIGGLKFHDAITDDSRLVLEVIKSACLNGAHALNYCEATKFSIEDNVIRSINCQDRYNGNEVTIRCKSCVNATGVWSDDVLQLIDKKWGKHVQPAKGIHIVVPLSAFETTTALFLPTGDNRYAFVIPWQRALMIGTTDTPYGGSLNSPLPNADEIDYLLSTVNHYSSKRKLNRSDVIASWAGLRPLVKIEKNSQNSQAADVANEPFDQSKDKNNSTSKISREHQIFDGPNGIIGVIGGKLTNYRQMSIEVIDRLLDKFPALIKPERKTSRTNRLMLSGWLDKQDFLTVTATIVARARRLYVEPATIEHLLSAYGKEAQNILDIIEREPHLNERICPDFPPIMAEIPHCVTQEMAVSLEDVMARRIRLAMLHHAQCLESAPKVARLMQQLLLWDEARFNAELDALQSFLNHPAPLPTLHSM
jgi:glycerol-3-phosphate dehydrogenase